MEKICDVCGKTFKARRKSSKFCSDKCRIINSTTKIKIKCDTCHKEILKKQSDIRKTNYCSKKCMNERPKIMLHESKSRKVCEVCGKEFKGRKETKCCSNKCRSKSITTSVKVNCSYCGKEITVRKSRIKRSKLFYCSHKCKGKNRTGINHFNYTGGIPSLVCVTCGKSYTSYKNGSRFCSKDCRKTISSFVCSVCKSPFKSHNKEAKFCSRGCSNKALSGINSPGYKDGRSPVTLSIRSSLKSKKLTQDTFQRDGYACRLCGQKGKYLHAHHIFPFAKIYSKFVKLYPKKTSKEDLVRLALEHEPFFNINNLVTLCSDCHYAEHRPKKQQEIKFA